MRAREEILNDRSLSVFQKAQQIFALNAHERDLPPPPAPKPDEVERAQLAAIASALAVCRDESRQLELRAATCEQLLPQLRADFGKLSHVAFADSPDTEISRLLILEHRIRIASEFTANLSAQRSALSLRVSSHLVRLNDLIQKFSPRRFYTSGNDSAATAATAISFIETLLQ